MWITVVILELKLLQMPQLSTQLSYVDNHGNSRAKTATYATIIHRTVSVRELIHAMNAPTPPPMAGTSGFIRSKPAGQQGPWWLMTWQCIFQVSALTCLCVGEMPTLLATGDRLDS